MAPADEAGDPQLLPNEFAPPLPGAPRVSRKKGPRKEVCRFTGRREVARRFTDSPEASSTGGQTIHEKGIYDSCRPSSYWQVNPYPAQHPVPVQLPVSMFLWITPVLFFARKCPTPSLSPPPVL